MAKKKSKKDIGFSFNDMVRLLKETAIVSADSIEILEEKKYYLVVCEGKRTEPNYFNYYQSILPKNTAVLQVIGEGAETIRVVEKAISVKKERADDPINPAFDEVWAIFDKDDFPDRNFNEAIELANRNGINSGFSNESFELWYVLHFNRLDAQLHRTAYIKILSEKLGYAYAKNDGRIPEDIRNKGDVKLAIKRAEELDQLHEGKTAAKSCPSTKVHILIKQFEIILNPNDT